jgi:hypothetical protein
MWISWVERDAARLLKRADWREPARRTRKVLFWKRATRQLKGLGRCSGCRGGGGLSWGWI